MPDNRLRLHETLCSILENRNAYFQPPESVRMNYPAIVYALDDIPGLYANDGVYLSGRKYTLTAIDKDPDSPLIGKVSALPTCRFVRTYQADNLNHWIFQIYY